ncbi:MAG: hypothetical protein O3A63_07240 [Proteobacteria bacterium]|nr:hypothetical protein [Pseudomonadota bacterium]
MIRLFFIVLLAGLSAGCAPPVEQKAAPAYRPVGNMLQFMTWVLEPAADTLWDSAGSIITADGEQDLAPQTDEQWQIVRSQAAVVAEAGNLLMLPGRAVDDEAWMEYSTGLIDAGIKAMQAAEAKDADALFEAGAGLYQVCLACHMKYVQNQ